MTDFAKIVSATDGAQVLFYKDNDEDGNPTLVHVTEEQGITAKMGLGFTDDDDGFDKRDAAFDGAGLAQANAMRELVKRAIAAPKGEAGEMEPAKEDRK